MNATADFARLMDTPDPPPIDGAFGVIYLRRGTDARKNTPRTASVPGPDRFQLPVRRHGRTSASPWCAYFLPLPGALICRGQGRAPRAWRETWSGCTVPGPVVHWTWTSRGWKCKPAAVVMTTASQRRDSRLNASTGEPSPRRHRHPAGRDRRCSRLGCPCRRCQS